MRDPLFNDFSTVFRGCEEFVFVYVDDILVFSSTPEEHERHLLEVFQRLDRNKLVIHPGKSTFGASEVEFCGHLVSQAGVRPLPQKVAAVEKFPVPTTIKALQSFLGMLNFFHKYLPRLAKVVAPLYALLSGKPKKLPPLNTSELV